jgi:hypothetical protein
MGAKSTGALRLAPHPALTETPPAGFEPATGYLEDLRSLARKPLPQLGLSGRCTEMMWIGLARTRGVAAMVGLANDTAVQLRRRRQRRARGAQRSGATRVSPCAVQVPGQAGWRDRQTHGLLPPMTTHNASHGDESSQARRDASPKLKEEQVPARSGASLTEWGC